ncbi:peptidase S10 [soil metagenome]
MTTLAALLALASIPHASEPSPLPTFVTHHRAKIRGKSIAYTATAGETVLTNPAGEAIGGIFSFTYLKDGPANPKRPVLFVFNGGPGSSSLWLHIGIVGPRRVVLDRVVNPSNVPPFAVEDNPNSLLDVADLVFIDPIGTGFSRILGKGKSEDFFGVDEDANSISQFIERWLSAHGRWNSPKFLMGESYGSARAALLPRALMGSPTYLGLMRGITVNGIILLGTTMEGHGGPESAEEQHWATALELPSFAATAWYHGKIDRQDRSLPDFDAEVTRFATTEYVSGLSKGAEGTLTDEERHALVTKLASYTGLPPSDFAKELSVSKGVFAESLLAEQGLSLGLYDSRDTLPTAHGGDEPLADDPAMTRYVPGFIAAFHEMLHDDLKVDLDRPYGAIVWRGLLDKWNWDRMQATPGQSFAIDLAVAMRRNEKLRVLVASGYYDLVTTAAKARHDLEAAGLPKDRVTYKEYESGHMLYLGETAEAFTNDVRTLIRSAS